MRVALQESNARVLELEGSLALLQAQHAIIHGTLRMRHHTWRGCLQCDRMICRRGMQGC